MSRPGKGRTAQEMLQGAAAAPGVAIGPAVCLRGHGVQVLRVPIRGGDLNRELEVLRLGHLGAVRFAIEVGGANTHTAIVARALDVPLVTGICR